MPQDLQNLLSLLMSFLCPIAVTVGAITATLAILAILGALAFALFSPNRSNVTHF